MLCIFHGDNTTTSRNALNETLDGLRAKFPNAEVLRLDGNSLAETELVEVLESPSMLAMSAVKGFSVDRIVHIDGLLSRRPSKEKERLVMKISDSSIQISELQILLWEGKQLSAAQLKSFQKNKYCKIQEFKLSKTLFAFLDSLAPKNGATMTALLASTLKTEAPELVMFMLVRRITELLLAVSHDSHVLDGVRSPWQRSQLSRQATHWTQPRLLEFHRKLLEIDEAIKTGSTASDAATHLDILILSL